MEIIRKYQKWKEGHDDDWACDEINEFAAELGRSGLHDVFETLIKQHDEIADLKREIQSMHEEQAGADL
jgi:hypothetical protein